MSFLAALPANLPAAALAMAANSIPVFPCHRASKRPLVQHGFKDASTDERIVTGWWTRAAGAMIGMPTGAVSNCWVLDIDIKGEHEPADLLQELQMEFGDFEGPIVRTPSGGLHVYFLADARIRINGSGKTWRPQIDWRGEGGYVCIPPSTNGKASYELIRDGDIVSAPPALVAQVIAAQGGPALRVAGGQDSLKYKKTLAEIVAEIRSDKDWHANTNVLIARWTAQYGVSPDDWARLAPLFQRPGYTLEQTVSEVLASAQGAFEKFSPEKRAINNETPDWPDRTQKNTPSKSYRNARAALIALGATFSFNAFKQRGRVHWPERGETFDMDDDSIVMFRQVIADRYGFDAGKENVFDALQTLCLEGSFDPVVDYLGGLKWDGLARLDTWLTYYMGAEDTPLNRAFGRKTLLGAVRRARRPGCKFDTVLVLRGPQGRGKSTALLILAGSDDVFSDQPVLKLTSQQQQEALCGRWIVELAELAGMGNGEIEHIKAFASRTHDRGRGAWGRVNKDQARHCVLIGTTNAEEFLRDPTGNRRFWPVVTGSIDLDALRTDRDQLWAEAAHREAGGEALELDPELYAAAAAVQAQHLESDPWEDVLRNVRGEFFQGEHRIFSADLMADEHLLNMPADRQAPYQARRLKAVMNRLGWDGPKFLKIGRQSGRGYARVSFGSTGSSEKNGGDTENEE